MALYAYDIKTLPNLLSFVFTRIDGEPETREYVIYGERDDRPDMVTWIREGRPELARFNNYYFDDLILVATLLYPNKLLRVVYDLSQKIINRQYGEIWLYNRLKGGRDKLQTIDLLQLLGGWSVSLKEVVGKLDNDSQTFVNFAENGIGKGIMA